MSGWSMNPAFAYIYDEFLADRRFERSLSALETGLAQRGMEGKVTRLAMFRHVREMVIELAKQGVKNIVFVGNDQTLGKVMWFLPDVDVTIGYIPIDQPSKIADLLGIPQGPAAVDVLAARLVETLDVGRIEDRYFLTEVTLPATLASLEIEGKYRLQAMGGGAIAIRNLGAPTQTGSCSADPKDGWLEGVIQKKIDPKGLRRWVSSAELSETKIRFKQGKIISQEPIDVFVDGHALNGFSFQLEIIPKKIRIITGRQRRIGEPR